MSLLVKVLREAHFDNHCETKGKGRKEGGREGKRRRKGERELSVRTSGSQGQKDLTRIQASDKQ